MDIKTKKFIDKVIAKNHANHKDADGNWLYTYLKSLYVRGHDKIIITCKIHGDFEQAATAHLQGQGCAACMYDSKRHTKNSFIVRAEVIHGKRYGYSKSDYSNNSTKIIINCKLHGDFLQTPSSHLNGNGCPTCGAAQVSEKLRKSLDDFILESNSVHNSLYTYSKTELLENTKSQIIITCKIHGDFKQVAMTHLSGKGCFSCAVEARANKKRYTTQQFIDLAMIKHGGKYIYVTDIYTGSDIKITVTCQDHGDFLQTPESHLQGQGCPTCGALNSGWTKTGFKNLCIKNNKGLGTLYVIRCFNGSESFYKIGITSRTTKLRYRNNSEMPYSYEIIYEFVFDADTIYDLEHDIFRNLVDYKYEPLISFGGQTECFSRIDYLESYFEYLSELQ